MAKGKRRQEAKKQRDIRKAAKKAAMLKSGVSDYAIRYRNREKMDSREGEKRIPAPCQFDYIHEQGVSHSWKWSDLEVMNHDRVDIVKRMRNCAYSPAKTRELPLKKYDHEAMNYYGWNF